MSVHTIPNEILDAIILRIIQTAGLHEATKLRLISRRFDKLTQECIFRLPRILLVSGSLSEPMRVKLINSKLRTENSNKLCTAIRNAAEYLTDLTGPKLYKRYIESLVRLAARSLMYWNLVDCLSTPPETGTSFRETQQDAMVAAAETNQLELVRVLLREQVNVTCNTRYFGEVLAAATSSGSLSLVLILLENCDRDDCTYTRNIRYAHAVQAAAVSGHEDIVSTLVNRGHPIPGSLYDNAIVQTVKAGQVSMIELLLNLRQEHSDSSREKAFWIALIRKSVEWDSQEILRYILERYAMMFRQATIGQAIEDACREGHHGSLLILLSALRKFSNCDAEHYTGGLFWAAWSGMLEHLADLVMLFEQEQRQILRALAGAISGKRNSVIVYLLQRAGVDLTDEGVPTRFTDVVNLVIPEAFSASTCARPITSLRQSLLDSSRSGDLTGVIEALQAAKVLYPNNLRSFSGGFSAAAEKNHPDILLYLCENLTPHLVSSCANSTAVVQIFKDFGWDIDQTDIGSGFPRLGNFVQDEHFCRWLIDNGASLNARGEMDVTPVSVAVRQASMSTIRLFLGRCNGIQSGQLLHFAIEREDEDVIEVIELLLNLGCPIDSIMFQDDPRSWMQWKLGEPATPLFTAAQKGKTQIVKFLLSRGADPTRPSTKGRTPLEVAETRGHTDIVDLLEQYR